jgi:hypothetical protein
MRPGGAFSSYQPYGDMQQAPSMRKWALSRH